MERRDKLIWAAGFFDGEGSVSVRRQTRSNGKQGLRGLAYDLKVTACQRFIEPLITFKELFGGGIVPYKEYGLLYYRWDRTSSPARDALVEMLPYLTVKRPIAELAIRFQEHMEVNSGKRLGKVPLSDDEMAARNLFYMEAKALNKRRTPLMPVRRSIKPLAEASQTVQ